MSVKQVSQSPVSEMKTVQEIKLSTSYGNMPQAYIDGLKAIAESLAIPLPRIVPLDTTTNCTSQALAEYNSKLPKVIVEYDYMHDLCVPNESVANYINRVTAIDGARVVGTIESLTTDSATIRFNKPVNNPRVVIMGLGRNILGSSELMLETIISVAVKDDSF